MSTILQYLQWLDYQTAQACVCPTATCKDDSCVSLPEPTSTLD